MKLICTKRRAYKTWATIYHSSIGLLEYAGPVLFITECSERFDFQMKLMMMRRIRITYLMQHTRTGEQYMEMQ